MKDNHIFNTGETQEELRKKYNPDGSVLRKAQLRMLDMLKYLDSVCKKIGVQYVIEGGNALGAVRHGGFIPWDDDVDVDMTREDYKKLCKYLLENPHPQYVLQTKDTDPGFWGNWVVLRDLKSEYIQDSRIHNLRKYRGMQIDIFPMEKNSFQTLHKIAGIINYINVKYIVGRNKIVSDMTFYLMHRILFPIFRYIDRFNVNKDYYMYPYGHSGKSVFPAKIMFPAKDISYEGELFSGPNDIDAYLRTFFNNYMDLPPINKRDKHQAKYKIWD